MTWLRTTSGRSVLARIDEPASGEAVGALVVVPSIGRETTVPFRRLRTLSVRAADAGFAVISILLSGDGESQDVPAEADLVAAWCEDVEAGLAAAARSVPDRPVNLLGWRLGAALAHRHLAGVSALSQAQPGAQEDTAQTLTAVTGRTVLWEPVSGSSFLRQHQNLRRFASPVAPVADGVELCGVHLSQAHVASLRTLSVPRRAPEGAAFEIIREPDPKSTLQLTLGSPHFVESTIEVADAVVSRLATGAPGRVVPVREELEARWSDARGNEIIEELVCVGPDRLPGVLTHSTGKRVRAAVLYTAIGAELRSGPGNAWTDAARELASEGVVGLRMDRRHLGEDTDVTAPREPYPYTEQSVHDVVAGAMHLELLTGSSVFGAGACSGAWSLLRGAESGPFAGVVAVNPVHWDPDPEHYDEAFYERTYRSEGSFSQILSTAGGGEQPENPAERDGDRYVRDTDEVRRGLRMRIYGVLHSLAIQFPRLRGLLRRDRPTDKVASLLGRLDRRTTAVLAMGPSEEAVFRAKGGPAFLRSARRGERVQVVVSTEIDHSLFAKSSRDEAIGQLRRLLHERGAFDD